MPCFIDTNILLYSLTTLPADFSKRIVAENILDRDDCVLSVQVLQEFYVQATRSSRADRLSSDDAERFVTAMLRFRIQPQTIEVMRIALEIVRQLKFSYWDSAIIAAAVITNCDTLFTEDLQHGQIIRGVKVVDPFDAG
jgi:predicted nucleic acid-binding protein